MENVDTIWVVLLLISLGFLIYFIHEADSLLALAKLICVLGLSYAIGLLVLNHLDFIKFWR